MAMAQESGRSPSAPRLRFFCVVVIQQSWEHRRKDGMNYGRNGYHWLSLELVFAEILENMFCWCVCCQRLWQNDLYKSGKFCFLDHQKYWVWDPMVLNGSLVLCHGLNLGVASQGKGTSWNWAFVCHISSNMFNCQKGFRLGRCPMTFRTTIFSPVSRRAGVDPRSDWCHPSRIVIHCKMKTTNLTWQKLGFWMILILMGIDFGIFWVAINA
jgi:hypothetical protein